MSAPIRSGMALKMRQSLTYSKLKAIRFVARRQGFCEFIVDQKIHDDKFVRDSKGEITAVHEKKFPKHVTLDPQELEKLIAHPENHFKKHAGLMRLKTVQLPELLSDNLRLILARNECLNKRFEDKCMHLREVFKHRHPPEEASDLSIKYQTILERVIDEELKNENIVLEEMTERQHVQFSDRVDGITRNMFQASHHNWKPINVSGHDAMVYVGARLAQNYAVMLQVFQEIKRDNPDFAPEFVYNYGSGSCSTIWAASNVWGDKVYEYFNVDPSKDINRLAQKLMANDIDQPSDSSIKGVHFRMFPSSAKNQYNLVVSGYLLMEMLEKERRECVQKLWKQTADYLVLVEHGTTAGYELIMEARNIILEMMWEDAELEGYVIAPCTHDHVCPKQVMKNPVCTFEVTYADISFTKKVTKNFQKKTEKYAYVIFKKGPKNKVLEYPRILDRRVGTRQTSCLLCCPDGEMNNFTFGRNSDKSLYWSLKRASTGDLLPVMWSQYDPDKYAIERHGIKYYPEIEPEGMDSHLQANPTEGQLNDMDRQGRIYPLLSDLNSEEKLEKSLPSETHNDSDRDRE